METRRWVFDEDAFSDKPSKASSVIQTILAVLISPIVFVLSIIALPFIYIAKAIRGLK